MTGTVFNDTNLDASSFNEVEIDLYFYVNGLNNGESLILKFFNGSNWIVVTNFTIGSGYFNNAFNNATVVLSNAQYNFSANSGFRLECNASKKNEQIYVDQITITGKNIAAARSQQSTATLSGTAKDVLVFPNPVKGQLVTVRMLDVDMFDYRIYSISGELMAQGTSDADINVSQLNFGIYFIELFTQDNRVIKKLVRQ